MILRMIFLAVIMFSNSQNIFSQSVNEQRYKLAESFESSGDNQGALRIYSELIIDEPDSEVFFDGYVRTMKALNNFSELLKVVKERLPKKESLEMLDLYAELNWRTGNPDEANKSWEKAISKFSSSQKTYLQISQTQINLRLFEKAINTLLAGRKEFNEPKLFYDPLTKLYIAVGDYKSGTAEILSMLGMDFNLPQAQGRLFALMINKDAGEYIGDELKRVADNNQNDIIFQEAYSWYLRTTGKSDEALQLVVRIDKMKNTNGLEILNFASSSARDGDYETAIKGFQLIIDKGKKNPYASSALFGFTHALEQKMSSSKTKMNKKEIDEIIESYQNIINDFPKSSNSADSRLRLALIYSEILNDKKKAISELEKLIGEFANSQYGVSAYLELGNIYIINDELDKAEKCFTKVKELHRFATPEQKDKALYSSALLTYFKGDIENAKKTFGILALNPDSDIANDVMRKLFIINASEEKIAALELFAKAEFKDYQGNDKEALEMLDEVSRLADKSMLGEVSLMKSAEIKFNSGNYKSCRDYLTKLNNQYPDSKENDKRLMLTAESFYYEDNTGEALKYYTELITKYSESIYLQDARKKIRIIRKDKI
ncbi:MAG: tetratricopeptide repeat protein [Candidatus Kapabacteria bacterium]|nr:tetratricopeptide repeat protein [Candidatus Kapabacteria bacterium]